MTKLLALAALSTVLAAPAFAQSPPSTRREVHAPRQQQSYRVHPYDPNYYQPPRVDNNDVNPDFQLGGDR